MPDINFSQPERRSFLIPGLIALLLLGVAFGALYLYTPHRIADLSVTHVALLPTHVVFKSNSIVVGSDTAQDDLYVLATVRVEDKLKIPLFIKDITGSLTAQDDSVESTSAVEKNDLPGLYTSFPKLKPMVGQPLPREATILPGQSLEGMVLLHFSKTEAQWNSRKAASVTVDFYHQGPLSVPLPKP